MGGGSSGGSTKKCGLKELFVFVAAIVAGTACSITSKTMMSMHGIGITGDVELFSKPIFQTLGMFVGMTFGLLMHVLVLAWKIPFPGYVHTTTAATTPSSSSQQLPSKETDALIKKNIPTTNAQPPANKPTPRWMYFFLIIPSVFDLGATALCMLGLRYLDVSIYQLLRGSGIIFVALMKQHVLGDSLYKFQWVGVGWNVVSVVLVGSTAILSSQGDTTAVAPIEALYGVALVMAGAFVQALQFVFEEKVMTMDDASAPPLLVIGMEGLWGTLLCSTVVYPLVFFIPGPDHGSYEDPFNTWAMLMNTPNIRYMFIVYFFAIFFYNLFAVLVTFLLNSVWHAILDNFRPITVWVTDMFLYYGMPSLTNGVGDRFGEPWTQYSPIQLGGMVVLLYGTAIYNAPNAGCIKLQGEWFAFGMDLTEEYEALIVQKRGTTPAMGGMEAGENGDTDMDDDEEWAMRQTNFMLRRPSSIAGDPTFAGGLHHRPILPQQQPQ